MNLNLSILFFTSRRRHTRWPRDWSSDVCSSDLLLVAGQPLDVGAVAAHPQRDALADLDAVDRAGVDVAEVVDHGLQADGAVGAVGEVEVLQVAGAVKLTAGHPVQLLLRSEEHTSELQSRGHLVCHLLLE